MLRYWLGLRALLTFLLRPPAFTFTAEAHEIERVDTPGVHQNRGDPAIHLDPHYDPNSTFWWGDIPESDDDPPFGIVARGAGEGPAAGRGPVAKVRVQEPEWKQVGGAVSAILRRALRDLYDVWDRVGVSLRVPFVGGWVRWCYGGDRWRHLPAPEGPPSSVRRARLQETGAGQQGGEKELSDRWTGDIKNFMADRKLGRVDVSGTELPLQVTTLEADIRKQSLGVVELGDLVCPHSECPRFHGCPQNFSSRFRACTNTIFSQTVTDLAKDPENCPDNREDKRVWNKVIHNPLCTHVGDSTPHSAYVARISVLDNVYVSWSGQTFDSENLFNQDGCSSSSDFAFGAGTPVSVFKELVNIAHRHGPAFYHGFIEFFPLFLVIASLMPHVEGIPIAQRIRQEGIHETVGQLLVGLSREEYNGYGVMKNELFFAHRVYVPQKQKCGHPSKALWHVLRKNHFLPPDGVPMLNPDWTIRTPKHVARDRHGYPEDWIVILGKRYGPRSLEQSDEIEAAMRSVFPSERVQVFDGNVGILEAKALFNRARLFLSPHGALCVNMAFMPFGGHLFEIRPREYQNACFHHLAEVCELHFYLVIGNGTFASKIDVDVPPVVQTLRMIKRRMEEEDKGVEPYD